MSSAVTTVQEPKTRTAETIASPEVVQSFLEILTDSRCRAMMEATSTRPRTAKEISEQVGVPLSTTYRKLDEMTEAGILADQTRLSSVGSHASEYRRVVNDVVLSVTPESGAKLTVAKR
jgi:predicted transcriptional regulator